MNRYFHCLSRISKVFTAILCLYCIATIAHADDVTATTPEQTIQNKVTNGDIIMRGSGYGGSFGTFEIGQQEIEPDDEQQPSNCAASQGNQLLRLWDGEGECSQEKDKHNFQTNSPIVQQSDE